MGVASWLCLGRRRERERSCPRAAGMPDDAVQEVAWGNGQCIGELDQRVDARTARSALQDADLRPVDRSPEAEFFLRQPDPLATADQVVSKAPRNLNHG